MIKINGIDFLGLNLTKSKEIKHIRVDITVSVYVVVGK